MKRTQLIWTLTISLVIAALGFAGYYFRDSIPLLQTTETSRTNSGVVDPLITANFDEQLHHLDLRSKKLTQMPDICSMVAGTRYEHDIWSVDLANNGFTEISEDIACLKNLSELNLSFNKISQIENLDGLTFLKKLDLGNNEIVSIEWLDGLSKNLADLHLGYNQLTSTRGLESLWALQSLQLQHNRIGDTTSIKDLVWLTMLKLEFNALTDANLPDLRGLTNLKILTVAENSINRVFVDEWNKKSYDAMKASEATK